MKKTQIQEKIIEIINQLIDEQSKKIEVNELLYEELGMDSIGIVQLYLSCQDEFGVILADELNLMEPVSVSSLADLVLDKINNIE